MTKVARRGGELVARYGGEEFVMLLPESKERDALTVAKRIQQAVRGLKLPHIHTASGFVTISIGIASLVPSRQDGADKLIQQADQALYRAKRAGRNIIRLASEE